MKPKFLFILHLPAPVHGSSVVGEFIFNSDVIKENINSKFIDLSTSRSVDEIGEKSLKKYIYYLKILKRIFKDLKVFKPDKVYLAITAKGIAFFKDFMVVVLVKLFKVPLVLHFHNKGISDKQHNFIYNLLYKITFKNSKVILLSPNLYNDVKKYVTTKQVYYCPNGVPKFSFSNKRVKKTSELPRLLFLSNLLKSKGIFYLLDACVLLYKRNILFNCNIVGGEADVSKEALNNKIKQLNLDKHVKYFGKKYGDEKIEIFNNSDVFVLPTYNECFPLVLLEASQLGIPIVSTNEGGIQDIVEDGVSGFLVEKHNVNALADKLEVLINNPELRKKMGNNAQKKYEEKFKIEIFEKNLLEILKLSMN